MPPQDAALNQASEVSTVAASPAAAERAEACWPAASACALACACAIDLAVVARAPSPAFLAALVALTLFVGLLHGAVWALAFALLRRAPARVALGAWFVASILAHAWLARELGGFSRLGTRYGQLAVLVLAACAASAVFWGCVGASLQPIGTAASGALLTRRVPLRRLCVVSLACVAAASWFADRALFPEQYPVAHDALRVSVQWALMVALAVGLPRLPRLDLRVWGLALVAFSGCALLLDARRVTTLDAFQAHPWAMGVLEISRALVDFDRDGQASLLGESDCAPWDARIHSGAIDIPSNGIDENCQLGDARARPSSYAPVPVASEPAPLDVVLITLDAVNPQHVGLYNAAYGPHGRATTPNLDRWAEGATVFDRAYSPGGWTSVALSAVLHGIYPRKLLWKRYFETDRYALVAADAALPSGERTLRMFPMAFDDPSPSLPEMLRRRGFVTHAVVDDGYSAMLQPGTGLERGFDHFHTVDALPKAQRNDAGTAQLALDVLRGVPAGKRLFLWVHFFGAHWPVTIHAGIRQYGSSPEDGYDHELAYLDSQLIRLLDALGERDSPVAVLIAADHGESFNASTSYHGYTLDEPVIRIPLLARVPGWKPGRVAQLASSIDLIPTILSLVGSSVPGHLDGIDLGETLQRPRARWLLSDTWRYDASQRVVGDYAAAYDGSRKLTIARQRGAMYVADQSSPTGSVDRLVEPTTDDALADLLRAYLEESGGIRLAN